VREYPVAPLVGVGAVVYVLLDYLATPRSGRAEAGSDALAIRWCEPGDLAQLDVTEGIESMVSRALAMDVERRRQEEAR
jgi:hypothetical protein